MNGTTTGGAALRPRAVRPTPSRTISSWPHASRSTTIQGTEITAGFFTDLGRATRTVVVEFDRRLFGDWSLHAEVIGLVSVDPADLHYAMRTDSFVDVSLTYNF